MAAHNQTHNQVLRPGNLSELFAVWNRFPGAVPFAGGIGIMCSGSDPGGAHGVFREHPRLPTEILSLERIEELRTITRTERYLEIGSMVRLNEILALGKIVPGAFSQTVQGIANPMIRNMATIGGNIFSSGDTIAALCALDAVYELRSISGSRWISALRFSSATDTYQKAELLTRIRIPLEDWNYTVYRKFCASEPDDKGGVLILVAKNRKNLLAGINVVFAGQTLLRDKDSEFSLEGKALPLDMRDAIHYRKYWETYLDGLEYEDLSAEDGQTHRNIPSPLLKDKILNAIEKGIAGLAD